MMIPGGSQQSNALTKENHNSESKSNFIDRNQRKLRQQTNKNHLIHSIETDQSIHIDLFYFWTDSDIRINQRAKYAFCCTRHQQRQQ